MLHLTTFNYAFMKKKKHLTEKSKKVKARIKTSRLYNLTVRKEKKTAKECNHAASK